MKNLVLIDDKGKYVVECLNGGFEFVHNTEDNSNWFNQKTLAKIFGVSVDNISKRLKQYSNRLQKVNNDSTKSRKVSILLKIDGSKSKVKFYDFKALTYLAYRINTVQAFDMLEWIDSSLNTMFNVATGKDSFNSNKDWLKNQCEVKAFQAATCKKSSDDLYSCGLKHVGDKTWSEYKKLKAEALKFKEMYLDYDRIDKIVASERNNSTKQLKLI